MRSNVNYSVDKTSRKVFPSWVFHSVKPFALRPITTPAAVLGLLNRKSFVKQRSCIIPFDINSSRRFLIVCDADGVTEFATTEPFKTTNPSVVFLPYTIRTTCRLYKQRVCLLLLSGLILRYDRFKYFYAKSICQQFCILNKLSHFRFICL